MRTILGLIVYLFITFALLIGAMYTTAITTWALDRGFYEDILANREIFTTFVESEEFAQVLALDNLDAPADAQNDDPTFTALVLALREVVTADYLQEQALILVDDIFALLESNNPDVRFAIDLTPIKENLSSEQGTAFTNVYITNLPLCEAVSEDTLPSEDYPLPTCVEDDASREIVAAQIRDNLPQLIAELPDELALDEPITVPSPQGGIATVLRTALLGLWGVAAFFWLVTAFVGGSNRRGILLWLGGTLLLPAILVLVTGLATNFGIRDFQTLGFESNMIEINGTPLEGDLALALTDLLRRTVGRIATGFLMVGGAALGVAALFLGLGQFAANRDDE